MPKLAESEIKSISLWMLVMVAVFGRLFAGFLGGGGYVRMPLLVYVLGGPRIRLAFSPLPLVGGSFSCLWLGHWTPDEVIQSEW